MCYCAGMSKTLDDVRLAFNGSRYRSIDELAAPLGENPGKAWQRKFANLLFVHCNIKPQRVWIDGKQCRVLDVEDFATDDKGKPRGTPASRRDLRLKVEHSYLHRIVTKLEELRGVKGLSFEKKWTAIGHYIDYQETLARKDR